MAQLESIRANFKQSITKLFEIDTRVQAMKQIQALISQNKTTANLRVWFSVLSENRKKHAESEIQVLDFIIKVYGKGLLDPIDKIPSLEKSVFRVTEILGKFFGEGLQNVAIACQKAWLDIYEVTLKDQPLQIKKRLLYDNLEAIINGGGGKVAQTTAQLILDGLLQRSLSIEDLPFFKEIAKRALVLFLKTTVIHPSTLTSLQTVLGFFNINNLIPLLPQIVAKILSYLPLAQPNSVGYKIKGEICNCLALIGQQIDRNGIQIYDKVIKQLGDMATDKVWAVQAPGRRALQIWNGKRKDWDAEFAAKNERIAKQTNFVTEHQSPLLNIKQNVSEYPKTYDQWMPRREQSPPRTSPNKPEMATDKSWAQLKRKPYSPEQPAYLHKNSGPGGGNNIHSVEQYYERHKSELTHLKKMEEIKKSIYGAKSDVEFEDTVVWDEQADPKADRARQQSAVKVSIVKEGESQEEDDDFLSQWQRVLQFSEKGKFEEGLKLLLEMDDDLYFLRFFLKYSSQVLANVTRSTSNKVLQKMLSIKKANFMEQMLFKMVAESTKLGIGRMLTNSQNLQIINNLENAGKISALKGVSEKLLVNYENSLNQ